MRAHRRRRSRTAFWTIRLCPARLAPGKEGTRRCDLQRRSGTKWRQRGTRMWASCGLLGFGRKQPQQCSPASRIMGNDFAHALVVPAVTVEIAVFELDQGRPIVRGSKENFNFAALCKVGLKLPFRTDLPG